MKELEDFGSKTRSRFAVLLVISGIVLLLDRLTKWWVMRHMVLGESRPFGRFFSLTFVENTGTAFGLLQNSNQVLLILGFVILGGMLYGARGFYERGGIVALVGVSLVLGGALGNLFDRYRHGHVIDFFDFHVWPVFNIADSAITMGTVLLMLGLFLKDRIKEKGR